MKNINWIFIFNIIGRDIYKKTNNWFKDNPGLKKKARNKSWSHNGSWLIWFEIETQLKLVLTEVIIGDVKGILFSEKKPDEKKTFIILNDKIVDHSM